MLDWANFLGTGWCRRLPWSQSIRLVPRWPYPRCHRGTMEVTQPRQRLLESVLCHQSMEKISLGGTVMQKAQKCNILCLIKIVGKKWEFLCSPRALKKRIILALIWQKNQYCLKHLMLYLRALSVRAFLLFSNIFHTNPLNFPKIQTVL